MSLQAATPTLCLRVRFFGPVRSRLKTEMCEIAWPADASADEFWTRLLSQFPEIALERLTIRLARNGEFLAENERLHPGDEIALIPPVSGG